MAIVFSAVAMIYRDGDGDSCTKQLCVVQRALELSGAAESALVWPRFLAGTLGRGTEQMYPFARVPTSRYCQTISAHNNCIAQRHFYGLCIWKGQHC